MEGGQATEFRYATYEEIDSTNFEVKRAIEKGESEGLVVCAQCQTSGYGRQGRKWASPEGGMYLSLLLRPQASVEHFPSLSLAAAVALYKSLIHCLPETKEAHLALKWPNDVVVFALPALSAAPTLSIHNTSLYKLGGISLEVYQGAMCLGVGVNVKKPLQAVEVGGKYQAFYLEDLNYSGTINQLAKGFLKAFSSVYDVWQKEGFAPFIKEYEAHLSLMNQTVSVLDMHESQLARGVVRGVNAAGALLVENKAVLKAIHSGEAHLVANPL